MAAQAYFDDVRRDPRYGEPKRLQAAGYKLYSKEFEDGMIREIFARIGTRTKTFVEIGAADGLENNTAALLFEGWRGLWFEGAADNVTAATAGLPKLTASGRLRIRQALVEANNVNALIKEGGFSGEIDLLSIDIDSRDLYVLQALTVVAPRVIVAEYNGVFPPHIDFVVARDSVGGWPGTDYYGVSLKTLTEAMAARGYALVGCNLVGCNAFFVRSEETADHFFEPFDAATHYEPQRFHAGRWLRRGHAADYRTLDEAAAQPS